MQQCPEGQYLSFSASENKRRPIITQNSKKKYWGTWFGSINRIVKASLRRVSKRSFYKLHGNISEGTDPSLYKIFKSNRYYQSGLHLPTICSVIKAHNSSVLQSSTTPLLLIAIRLRIATVGGLTHACPLLGTACKVVLCTRLQHTPGRVTLQVICTTLGSLRGP